MIFPRACRAVRRSAAWANDNFCKWSRNVKGRVAFMVVRCSAGQVLLPQSSKLNTQQWTHQFPSTVIICWGTFFFYVYIISCRSSILSVNRSLTLHWSLVLMCPVGWYTLLQWCKKLLPFSFWIVNSSPWAEVVDLFKFSLFIVYVLSFIYRLILQYLLLCSRYFK